MKAADIQRIFAKPPRRRSPGRGHSLTRKQRERVRAKTGGTCHVCGGTLGSDWQADHVVPHHLGGAHVEDNYLPACRVCNRLRENPGSPEPSPGNDVNKAKSTPPSPPRPLSKQTLERIREVVEQHKPARSTS